MDNSTASLPPDEDRGPRLEAAYWTWSVIAVILVALRFYARIKIRGLGWDDWMMLITVVCFTSSHFRHDSLMGPLRLHILT